MKHIFCRSLFTLFLSIIFFGALVSRAHAEDTTYTVRNLTLDTLGKTVLLEGTEPNLDGKLSEFTDNKQPIKDWKVKYEHKGSMRHSCEPPVLNLSFDKIDGKDKPKALFNGASTYPHYPTLEYQKLRLIPECDGWNDWGQVSEVGFSGQLNVSLREFVIFKIFRKFGIPTADIVGFANVTFIAPDAGYSGHSFRYMMVQKPSEQDDQIPFTKQYGLSPMMYESGISPWYTDYEHMNRLTSATLTNSKDKSTAAVSFDQEATIRLFLLTDFLTLEDVSALHNEDWGTSLTTGKTFIIPHGFDASFPCSWMEPSDIGLVGLISNLPASTRPSYQSAYYRIAKEIFGDPSSLNKMLALVDEFPYKDVDKKKLVEFLKLRFYQFATYYNSEAFAQSLNQKYQSQSISLPFASDSEYYSHVKDFKNSCSPSPAVLSDVTVTVIDDPTLKYDSSGSSGAKNGIASLVVEIKTGNSDLEMQKSQFGNAFPVNLIGTKNSNNNYNQSNIKFDYTVISGNFEDIAGPYYLIPAHSVIRFALTAKVYGAGFVKDNYYVELAGFQPSGRVQQLPFSGKTNSLALGDLEDIKILAPSSGENLIAGQNYKISWTGSPNNSYSMMIVGSSGTEYYPYDPSRPRPSSSTTFDWTVGKVFIWKNVGSISSYVDEGQYRVRVRYDNTNIESQSDYFNIVTSASSTPPSATIIDKPVLSMVYDPLHEEASLVSTFKVLIDSGSRSRKILKEHAFWSYLTSSDNYVYNRGQSYDQPVSTTDSGDGYYVIPANSKALFTVNTTFDPKIMFSGVYSSSMQQVQLTNTAGDIALQLPTDITTNSLVVVGEKSPYVNSVSPKHAPSNGILLISGVRFSTTEKNTVTLNSYSNYSDCPVGFTCSGKRVYNVTSFDGTTLRFVPNIDPGDYNGQVVNPKTGASNTFYVEIATSTSIQSVTPDKSTINSGQSVTLKYVIPTGAVSAKLNLYCPPGAISQEISGVDRRDLCNTWSTFTSLPQSTTIRFYNSMAWPQHVIPNFYVYFENDPNYAIGVTSDVLVLPVTPSNIKELIKATSTTSVSPIAAATTNNNLFSRALSATQKAINSVVSSASSLLNGNHSPSPSPSSTPRTNASAKSSPVYSPSISPSPTPTHVACPSGFSAYGNQCIRSYSPTPLPTLIINKIFASPSPSSNASPSARTSPSPSPTPTATVSPRASVSPTPTLGPIATPTPLPSPTVKATPVAVVATPVATPNATPSPSSTPAVTSTTTPSGASPKPSPSPVSSWAGKSSTASVFDALEKMARYFLGN